MKLSKAVELFLNSRKTYCASDTIKYYEENLARFFEFSGDLEVSKMDEKLLQDYILFLRGRDVTQTTVRTYVRAVKTFFNWMYQQNMIRTSGARVKLPRDDRRLMVPLTQSEVKQINSIFDDSSLLGIRNLCIFHLMLDAGLRCKDVIQLNVSDILFDSRILIVQNSKYNKSRTVPIGEVLFCHLQNYLAFSTAAARNNCLFCNLGNRAAAGERITSNTIKQLFAAIKVRSGVDRVHPHLLRHTFATSFVMGGGNLEFLRLYMGHSDYEVTRDYLHIAATYQLMHYDIYRLDPIFFQPAYQY